MSRIRRRLRLQQICRQALTMLTKHLHSKEELVQQNRHPHFLSLTDSMLSSLRYPHTAVLLSRCNPASGLCSDSSAISKTNVHTVRCPPCPAIVVQHLFTSTAFEESANLPEQCIIGMLWYMPWWCYLVMWLEACLTCVCVYTPGAARMGRH